MAASRRAGLVCQGGRGEEGLKNPPPNPSWEGQGSQRCPQGGFVPRGASPGVSSVLVAPPRSSSRLSAGPGLASGWGEAEGRILPRYCPKDLAHTTAVFAAAFIDSTVRVTPHSPGLAPPAPQVSLSQTPLPPSSPPQAVPPSHPQGGGGTGLKPTWGLRSQPQAGQEGTSAVTGSQLGLWQPVGVLG